MRFESVINGLAVRAEYTDASVERIFLPLLEKLCDLRRTKGRPVLMLLAAPPGAGKSTLAAFLEKLAEGLPYRVRAVGMDGFHHYGAYLSTHTCVRDGREISLRDIKGAPETFDLEKLTGCVRAAAAGERVVWPVYDRRLHDPTEGAPVDADILIMEGNYLLLDAPGWRELRKYADYTVRVTADAKDLRERLIARKAAGGMARADAERFVERSDMKNVALVSERSLSADMTLTMRADGAYVPAELWDAYNAGQERVAGVTLVRGEPVPPGLYHLTCEIAVRHTDGTYLLMRRDPRKVFGNRWELTAGGAVVRGEDAREGAERELREETGITGVLEPIGVLVSEEHRSIFAEFLCVTDMDKHAVTLQEGETTDYRWVDRDTLLGMPAGELAATRTLDILTARGL